MYKYLHKKLEQAHGATIENLIFLPNELCRNNSSDSFKEFQGENVEKICETLGWRKDKDVYDAIQNYTEDEEESFALFLYENEKHGFLAECYFPECSDFRFPEGEKTPSSWSVHKGICRIEWLYSDSIGELVEKIVDKSEKLFNESVEKEKADGEKLS